MSRGLVLPDLYECPFNQNSHEHSIHLPSNGTIEQQNGLLNYLSDQLYLVSKKLTTLQTFLSFPIFPTFSSKEKLGSVRMIKTSTNKEIKFEKIDF